MALAFMHNRRPGGAVVVLSGAHLHRYKRIEVVDPTCTEQGYTIRSCKCDDSIKTNYTEPLGHMFGEWGSDDNGHWHTCLRCGEVETSAHTPGAEATEDTPQTCTACGYVLAPALGHIHKYTDEVTPPTCTEKGYTTHICKCGDSYIDSETEPLGHDMTSTVIKAATCTTAGTRYYWCRRECGHSYYETIGTTHNRTVKVEAVPATCTTAGSTAGLRCVDCGKVFNVKTIPALGHKWGGDDRHKYCTVCGASYNG